MGELKSSNRLIDTFCEMRSDEVVRPRQRAEDANAAAAAGLLPENAIPVSCETGEGVNNLKEQIFAAMERSRKAELLASSRAQTLGGS